MGQEQIEGQDFRLAFMDLWRSATEKACRKPIAVDPSYLNPPAAADGTSRAAIPEAPAAPLFDSLEMSHA